MARKATPAVGPDRLNAARFVSQRLREAKVEVLPRHPIAHGNIRTRASAPMNSGTSDMGVQGKRHLESTGEANPVGRRRDIGQEALFVLMTRYAASNSKHASRKQAPGMAVEPDPGACARLQVRRDIFLEVGDDAPLRVIDDADDRNAGFRIIARPQREIGHKARDGRDEGCLRQIVLGKRELRFRDTPFRER